MSAKIYKINFKHKDNYAVYNDTDSMTDYFHATSGSVKYMIECIKEDGSDVIFTTTINNDPTVPTLRRIKQICKACGYYFIDKSSWKTSQWNKGEKWFDITYELHKGNAPKNLVQGNALSHVNTSPEKKVSPIKTISPNKAGMPAVPSIHGVTKPLSRAINTTTGMKSMPMRMLVTSYGLGSKKKKRS